MGGWVVGREREEEVYSVNKKGIEGDENKAEERTKITRTCQTKRLF